MEAEIIRTAHDALSLALSGMAAVLLTMGVAVLVWGLVFGGDR